MAAHGVAITAFEFFEYDVETMVNAREKTMVNLRPYP